MHIFQCRCQLVEIEPRWPICCHTEMLTCNFTTEGKALEIWTLWDRAVGPRSVGLIDRARTTPLRLDQLPLGTNQLFEITIEPATGSPTGRPTGPIVAKGTTSQAL